MAPIEGLHSRDLAWISEFVMQQVTLMMRPIMEQLDETDATFDYVQRAVDSLSSDMSRLESDLGRTNKNLAILRQGLGVQNEGRCMLQRDVENTTLTVKHLDGQIESLRAIMPGMDENIRSLGSGIRTTSVKHEELAKQVVDNVATIEELQVKVEQLLNDAHFMKDERLNNDRFQLGIGAKLDDQAGRGLHSSQLGWASNKDPWLQKKNLVLPEDAKGLSRPGLKSLQERTPGVVGRSSSGSAFWRGADGSQGQESSSEPQRPGGGGGAAGEELSPANPRLPPLAKPYMSRPSDGAVVAAEPRPRFPETMAKPPSRGCSQ